MTDHEKSEEYRKMAADCLQLAKRAVTPADTAFLLDLAFRWQMLAQGTISDLQEASRIAFRLDDGPSSASH